MQVYHLPMLRCGSLHLPPSGGLGKRRWWRTQGIKVCWLSRSTLCPPGPFSPGPLRGSSPSAGQGRDWEGTGMPHSPGSLSRQGLFSLGGCGEPGHPAARPSPDQGGGPPCSRLRLRSALSSAQPSLPRHAFTCARRHRHSLPGPSGLPASLSLSQTPTNIPS